MEIVVRQKPRKWQDRLLRSGATRTHVVAPRQAGKSSLVIAISLHEAESYPGDTVLVVSASQRQSSDLFRNIVSTYKLMGRPISEGQAGNRTLVLAHGGRIVCAMAELSILSGHSPRLIVVDDVEFISNEVRDLLVSMILRTGGRLIELESCEELRS